jgi:hypothetical protein
MDNDKILQSIKEELTNEGLDCVVQNSEELPEASLIIYTGSDRDRRTQLIEIKVQTTQVDPSFSKNAVSNCVSFQLNAFFPFVVTDLAMSDVAQFLHFLNFQVEIPGFYLNYINNTILYRYVLLSENEHIPKKILISLVGIAMFFQDVFGTTLERLAKGEVTFVTLMQEIQEILAKVVNQK